MCDGGITKFGPHSAVSVKSNYTVMRWDRLGLNDLDKKASIILTITMRMLSHYISIVIGYGDQGVMWFLNYSQWTVGFQTWERPLTIRTKTNTETVHNAPTFPIWPDTHLFNAMQWCSSNTTHKQPAAWTASFPSLLSDSWSEMTTFKAWILKGFFWGWGKALSWLPIICKNQQTGNFIDRGGEWEKK